MGLKSFATRYAERERDILRKRKASRMDAREKRKVAKLKFKEAVGEARRAAYLEESKKQAIARAKLQAQRKYGGPVRNWLGQPIQQPKSQQPKSQQPKSQQPKSKKRRKKRKQRTVVKYVYR